MDKKLLEILACPICKARLFYDQANEQLICKYDSLAYPIRNGIPIMLEEQSVPYKIEE